MCGRLGSVTRIASLPEPPYTAVIFSNIRTDGDNGYGVMAMKMVELASRQPGYLGYESTGDGGLAITVSYWVDDAAAQAWKQVHEHAVAQQRGREAWYADYQVRVATVNRSYGPNGH
ncbi:MAG: antibiotic biosynthesis monooxygenase [Marmoricola sp.]|nr:antibiotic biosynthesis monooxygenase [Marmoricola sp.]